MSASKNSAENSLAIQETATYIATFIINQDAIDAGGVSNVATVTVETDDGNSFSEVVMTHRRQISVTIQQSQH